MTRTTRCLLVILSLVCARSAPATAQESTPKGLRVFVDCQTTGCDFDYFRTALPWVDWMRERQDADVHVLVTSQTTGGSGSAYTLTFLGRGRLAGRGDTLSYVAPSGATPDETRRGLAQRMGVGLVPFATRTALMDRLKVTAEGARPDSGAAVRDPWNYWVFSMNANQNLDGESSYKSLNVWGGFTATRVTPAWKLRFALSENYQQSDYELSEGNTRTVTRSYSFNTLSVRSVSRHWSGGLLGRLGSSTYGNTSLSMRAAPAVEYDMFPYDESTRRQLTVLYSVGADYFDYIEPTIYRKTRDRLLDQALNVSLQLRQPWGSIATSVGANHYLTWSAGAAAPAELRAEDGPKYSLDFTSGVDVRLVKGLSLSFFGNYMRIRNQIGLRAAGASDEDILLRLRQLRTDYSFYTMVGLRYTFGSIHNNIVNPRFSSEDSGGSTMVISF